MTGDEGLATYMNDQLALGVLWRDLARQAATRNRGTDVGAAVGEVATEIAEDVETFSELMDRLGLARSRVKPALASFGAQVARLKLDTPSRDYSDVDRFEDLDFLAIGIDGKKLLWATLRDCAGLDARLPDVDFDRLIERAQHQRDVIEPHRLRAARIALGGIRTPA